MPIYEKKDRFVGATQWFKNGDHPNDNCEVVANGRCHSDGLTGGKVVRRFRRPDISGKTVCFGCGCAYNAHGWLDQNDPHTGMVCPGDFVITDSNGTKRTMSEDAFHQLYEEVLDRKVPVDTRDKLTERVSFEGAAALVPSFEKLLARAESTIKQGSKDFGDVGGLAADTMLVLADAGFEVVPKSIAMALFTALDDVDTASDMAKGDMPLYCKLVQRFHSQRWLVADTDGFKVEFFEELGPTPPIEFPRSFAPSEAYMKRLHNVIAAMMIYLGNKETGQRAAFEDAWMVTVSDIPEVIKLATDIEGVRAESTARLTLEVGQQIPMSVIRPDAMVTMTGSAKDFSEAILGGWFLRSFQGRMGKVCEMKEAT